MGGGRSGSIEERYAEVAKQTNDKSINNTKELAAALAKFVPNDVRFKDGFFTATVSQSNLARYYLRALENTKKSLEEPELIPNDDIVINLEHILPHQPDSDWLYMPPELLVAHVKRIGNMALLPSKINSNIGNREFKVKRVVYANSNFLLTSMVANEFDWGVEQIAKRQEQLAELAVKTWSLKVR